MNVLEINEEEILESIDELIDENDSRIEDENDSNKRHIGILLKGPKEDPILTYLAIVPLKVFYEFPISTYVQSYGVIPPNYSVDLGILTINILDNGDRIPVIKTRWLKNIQRKYKKAFQMRKHIVNNGSIHSQLRHRELNGSFRGGFQISLLRGLLNEK